MNPREREMEEKIKDLELQLTKAKRTLVFEVAKLKRCVGAWRRKVEGKGLRREHIREGYSTGTDMHYIVYILDVPADLPIEEVLKIIKNEMAEDLYPFTLKRIDYSKKYKKWVAEFEKELNFDTSLELDFLLCYYNNTDN